MKYKNRQKTLKARQEAWDRLKGKDVASTTRPGSQKK